MQMKIVKNSLLSAAIAMASLTLASPAAHAVVQQANVNNSSQTFYDGNISTVDLINVGSPSLGSFTTSKVSTFGTGGVGTHNGTGGSNSNTTGLSYWAATTTNVVLDYILAGSPTGYDITSINSIYGWSDSALRHAAQRYTVSFATLANPGFTPYHTVLYDPFTGNVQGSTQVTLTDTNGRLATGVTGIRFNLTTDNGTEVGVVHELDVFGSATAAAVPEPATATLGLLALTGLMLRRRTVA